jgi:hypothetical protein
VPAVLPLLLSLLALPPQTPSAPISAFFAPSSSYYSSHPLIVLQITELLLSLPQETFSLAIIPGLEKVITPDDVPDVSPAWVGSGWNVKAVYDLLRRASEHQEERIRERSQEILEGGMQTRLELIFLGLVQTAVRRPACFARTFIVADAHSSDPAEALLARPRGHPLAPPRHVLRPPHAERRPLHPALADGARRPARVL